MHNILYLFITHKNNLKNVYSRIEQMMVVANNTNYIIVQGGSEFCKYDTTSKILSIDCNDKYEGLPEKVLKTFKYIVESNKFDQYTQFIKLDDDMVVKSPIDYNFIEKKHYIGCVHNSYGDASCVRSWHIGKCSKNSLWNDKVYSGEYTPWCKGGHGYIISRYAIETIKDDTAYEDHIYEDLYIAILLKNRGIGPIHTDDLKHYFVSPDHH